MKTINLVIFGIGNVGSTLLNQINSTQTKLKKQQDIDLRVPIIANSQLALFAENGKGNWKADFDKFSVPYKLEDILSYVENQKLKNLIAIDVTASEGFVQNYNRLIASGFHLISANKVANTLDIEFYESLRKTLKQFNKQFLYETNVGAGLPVIETVRNLHNSGEGITKIKGVFSGSLSYIFNRFSEEDEDFSNILNAAANEGLTEPDSRDDLSGKDVARKLLILARELGLKQELKDVKIQSLVPKQLNGKTTLSQFNKRITELNPAFQKSKNQQPKSSVLRYVGELDTITNTLDVKLVSEPKASPLGQLKGADTLFEVYTESYKERPLVIQGAGAGKAVTARGVLSDIIKISAQLN
ncbi:homoserine dehydrogenase family protein [Winogradskyella ursingii]|uniref:aspartate kinase n=1 Tax=Winogradskyella ursingii TaxID=2686079 RepID=UPI001FE5670D|nr:aspartate kinase [Winogradskyella ursingii]